MRYFKYSVLLLLFLALSQKGKMQEFEYDKNYFRSPLDIPSYLSANFGELRSGHFHAGIDFKTQGQTGKRIYACADGYISRIKVSASGYGKTLYINHPNGLTTVYGHMDIFNLQIDQYVRHKQYELESFEVNLFPKPNELPVKKSDVIGLSGNSGYSFGPHLHFEIRKSTNQVPINPLFFDFNVTDNVDPKIFSVLVYPQDGKGIVDNSSARKRFLAHKSNGVYKLSQGDTITGYGTLAFAIEANDYFNYTHNKCGVYKIQLRIDDQLVFSQTIDAIPFSETRYINSHMDYELNLSKRKKIHKSFLEPNNNLTIYDSVQNNGYYQFLNSGVYEINYLVKDVHGNTSELEFYLQADPSLEFKEDQNNYVAYFKYDEMNQFDSGSISVVVPPFSLYKDLKYQFEINESRKFLSQIYSVHNFYTPLHKDLELQVVLDSQVLSMDTSKLILALYNKKNEVVSVGGTYKNLRISAETRSFGDYFVTIDTIAPKIIPEKFTPDADLSHQEKITFLIQDELSGIKSYNGYIDDKWVLFEYDLKNDRLTYYFDEMMADKKDHIIRIVVEDERGNTTEYTAKFFWQEMG